MTVTIGVDAGQSEIRLRSCGAGEGDRTAPGVSHLEGDTVRTTIDAVATMWASEGPARRIVAGLTTIPADQGERRRLALGLAEVTGASEAWVCNDSVTFHAGALEGSTGIALAVGTGVACLAVDSSADICHTFDGAGYLIGDEGGGFWIGRHGIRAALAAAEDRGPATDLTEAVAGQFGGLTELAARIHSEPRAVDRIARVAVTVADTAAQGDEVALSIVERAAHRLANTVAAAVRFLSSASRPPVAIGGRVADLLGDRLDDAIGRACASRPFHSNKTGLDGACHLARTGRREPYTDLITVVSRST